MSRTAYRRFWLIVFVYCFVPSSFAQSQPSQTSPTAVEEFASALVAAKTNEERSVLLAAKKELQTPALVQALLKNGTRLRLERQYAQALSLCQFARELAERQKDKAGLVAALTGLGDIHRIQNNADLARELYQQSMVLWESLGDQAGVAGAWQLLGFTYSMRGDLDLALEHYQRSLAIRETLNDQAAMARVLNNIGDVHRLQKHYDLALEAYQKAISLFEATGNKAGLVQILNGVRLVYTAQGSNEQARTAQQRILALNEDLKNTGQDGATARQALVQRILAAETDAERKALIETDSTLLTADFARLLFDQAREMVRQRNYLKALPILRLAEQIAERVGDKATMANALLSIGDIYRTQRLLGEALRAFQQSLALWESSGDQVGIIRALVFIGATHSQQGNLPLGLEHFQKSLAIAERANNRAAIAEVLYFIGENHRLQQRYDSALEAYHRGLSLHEASGNKNGMILALTGIRLSHTAQGSNDRVREAQQKILALNEEMKSAGKGAAVAAARQVLADRILAADADAERKALLESDRALLTGDFARLLVTKVSELMQRHDYSKALPILRMARQIAEQTGDKPAMASALMTIGDAYRGQAMTGEAREVYQLSLALQEEMKNADWVAQLHIRLGWVSNIQHSPGQALWHFRKAIEVSDSADNKLWANIAMTHIGSTYIKLSRYDRAQESLEQARTYFEAMGNKADLINVLQYLADLHLSREDYEQARRYAEQSLAICEGFGDVERAANQRQALGNIERLQGKYAAANGHYQKTLEQYEAVDAQVNIIGVLQQLAETHYRQKHYREALRTAERALAIARPLGFPYSSYAGHTIAGKAHLALNQPSEARMAFDEAITIIERMRAQLWGGEQEGQHFFADKISPYHEIITLFVRQQQPAAALAFAERAKARTLLDLLRNNRTDVVKAMTAEEQAQERHLKNDLFEVNAELLHERQHQPADPARLANLVARQQKARQAFETFQAGLYAMHPELKIQRGEAPVLRSEEIGALVPDARTALLEFVVAEEQAFLFVITKKKIGQPPGSEIKVYPLAIRAKDFGAQVEDFRQQLAKRSPEFRSSARELYDLLLKPAAAQLQGKTSLVIVPDGPLWELPFQALQPAANRFLIEDFSTSYAPSLTALREMAKARKKPSSGQSALLALGNPALGQETVSRAKYVLMDEKLDPLPEAEAQVKTLGRLYGPRQSKIYTGAEAREERAKAEAGNYRILHLATHGVLNDTSPMYSHLLLAQTGEPGKEAHEDGLLEAWELMKLDLNADLVVLSACETARGRVGAGEGVIGLTWALFVAGCPRTVVSQWKVESASTTELMVEFHRQLKTRMQNPKSSFGAAQSLRTAALKMLRSEKYRHPFWWAGFVVVGDGF